MRRKITVILAGVITAIFLPIILSDQHDRIDTYLVGVFISAEILLFVFDQIFQTKRETREDRKEHSKELLLGLKILQAADINSDNTKFDVFVPFPYQNYIRRKTIFSKIGSYSCDEIINDPNLYPQVNDIHYLQSEESNFEGLFEHLKDDKEYTNIHQKWTLLQKKIKVHTETNHLFLIEICSIKNFELGLQKIENNEDYQKLQKECEESLNDFKESLKPLIKKLRGVVIIKGKCQWCP